MQAAVLAGRIADLDQGSASPARQSLDTDLTHFTEVLSDVIPPGQLPDPARAGTLTSAEADQAQRSCRLLQRIARRAPQLTDGPLDLAAQYWTATGNPRGCPPLSPNHASPASCHPLPLPRRGAKPFNAGLFTSTGVAGSYGMWRCYLRAYENSDTLHRKPWHTWRLQPRDGIRVCEVRDAAAWTHLITDCPRLQDGYLQPDWAAAAARYDAIHLTLRAITAIEGISFTTPHGPTLPPYWSVETTFWLTWCFTTAELTEIKPHPTDP